MTTPVYPPLGMVTGKRKSSARLRSRFGIRSRSVGASIRASLLRRKRREEVGGTRVVTDDEGPADERVEDEGPDRDTEGGGKDEDGESVLYDEDFDIDHPALMSILGNEEVAKVHSSVNFTRHLQVVEQQSLQHAAFLKYIRGTAKEKAEKSLAVAKAGLKKAREDMALRTAKVEAAKKEVLDLRAEKEKLEKAGGSATGMNKQAVTALVKKNLARYQAKWDEEKAKLVAIGNNLVKDSFENAMAQLSLRNPGLVRDGVSHEFEVFRGQVCKVDTAARKLVSVDSGVGAGGLGRERQVSGRGGMKDF
ncbi:hypothetical protein SESBI_18043 [Sesbania bispinosa]|nr:hypothetical protein SESBI_18043 [Sesbania bispinosa]